MTDLVLIISQKLGLEPAITLSHPRLARIIKHYRSAIAKGMPYWNAIDRCWGDICGCNYHPEREQRNEPKWQ